MIKKRKQFIWMALAVTLAACGGENNKKAADNASEETAQAAQQEAKKTIVFFGNSLTAGYGIDPGEAFPALIQQRLDALGKSFTVINAGLSGETTASGVSRVDWVIGQQQVDIFILELGGNDGLRGIAVTETRKNLLAIIDKVRTRHPEAVVILAGMMVPPNMGPAYSKEFKAVFPEVAAKAKVAFIPFILENVGGEKELNLEDGIHPTPEGHKMVAENVWAVLQQYIP